MQLQHSGRREPWLRPVTELGCDLPAIGLVADDDYRLAAPLDRRSDRRGGRAGRERVTWLARAVKGVRQSLAGLARSQERARQDRVGADPVGGKLLAERPRLLAAREAKAAQLVRVSGLGIRMPDEKEPQAQACSRAGK